MAESIPQQQLPSISQYVSPRTFQPIITPYMGAPKIDDNIQDLNSKLEKLDTASSEFDLLKAKINRLDVDNDIVEKELSKYDVSQYTDDPFAIGKIKAKAAEFQSELVDPSSPIGVAVRNYEAEKAMTADINKRVQEGDINAEEGEAIMREYKQGYRRKGGLQGGKTSPAFYPEYNTPASKFDGEKFMDERLKDWAVEQTGYKNVSVGLSKDKQFIIKNERGEKIRYITPQELQTIRPLLENNGDLRAYFGQRGEINTYGKSTKDLSLGVQEKLIDEIGRVTSMPIQKKDGESDKEFEIRKKKMEAQKKQKIEELQDGLINIQEMEKKDNREGLVNIYREEAITNEVDRLMNYGVTKKEHEERTPIRDADMKVNQGYWNNRRFGMEQRKLYATALGVSAKGAVKVNPKLLEKASQDINKSRMEQERVLNTSLNGTGLNIKDVDEGYEKMQQAISNLKEPDQNDFDSNEDYQKAMENFEAKKIVIKNDFTSTYLSPEGINSQEMSNLYQTYRDTKQLSKMVHTNNVTYARRGGFDPNKAWEENIPFFDGNKEQLEESLNENGLTKEDLLEAVSSGMDWKTFSKNLSISSLQGIQSRHYGQRINMGEKEKNMNELKDMYENLQDDFKTAIKEGTRKPLDKSYGLLKGEGDGTGSDKNWVESRKESFEDLIEAGQEVIDTRTGFSGNLNTVFNELVGNDTAEEDVELEDVKIKGIEFTTDSEWEGRQGMQVTAQVGGKDGKEVTTTIALSGNQSYTQTKELAKVTIEEGYKASKTDEKAKAVRDSGFKLYTNSVLKGGFSSNRYALMLTGGEDYVYRPDGTKMLKIVRDRSGYRIMRPDGSTSDYFNETYKSPEQMETAIGKLLYTSEQEQKKG